MRVMQRSLLCLLSALLAVMPVMSAQAAMIGTDQIVSQATSSADPEKLRRFLDQDNARQQLQSWGVDPAMIDQRIDSLTDSELSRINQEIDNLNAGGTSVLGVLLIIFLVFVITDVIGATDIFPFIKPVR
jgi:hypothetical protein